MAQESSLFSKTFHGVLWTVIDVLFSKGFPLLIIILLARILGPEPFGLFGILVIFLALGVLLTESGLTTSLIRHRALSRSDYSTVFYLNILLNIFVYAVIFLTAPWVAGFFEKPVLAGLIRAIAGISILSSFTAVHLAILNKKMRFRKIALLNLPGAIIGGITGLVLANRHFGIWSLVYMHIVMQFVTSVLLWWHIKWRPSFEYSKAKGLMHFKFGINMLVSGFLDILFRNSYNIIIGKFYPIQSLAFFERARSLQEYPTVAITGIANKVSYPLMAKLHHQGEEGNSFFKKLIQVTFFINTPFILILAGVAEPLFRLILGNEWIPAVPYFQILCISSIFYPHHVYNLNILKVKGRSDLFLKLEIVKKILLVAIIILSAPFGILGLIWGMVVNSVLSLYINIYYSGYYISYSFRQQVLDLLPNLFIGLVCFLGTRYLCLQFNEFSAGMQLVGAAILGLVSYALLNILLNKGEFSKSVNLILKR